MFIVLLGFSAFFITMLSIEDVSSGKVDSIFKTPIYGSVVLFIVIIGLVIHYMKLYKTVWIDHRGIKLSNAFKIEFIPWSEFKEIELIGKCPMTLSAESTNLILKNGRKIYLITTFYQNMPALRMALDQVNECLSSNKKIALAFHPETSVTSEYVDVKKMTKYAGNHFLSFNGLVIYGWIFFSIYAIVYLSSYFGAVLILICMLAFFYSLLGYQLHYYYLDSNYLVVRNHVWPWVNHTYRIADIKQIAFEIPYRRSTSLRIITKDYRSKLYPGGSLRNKTWNKLLRDIEEMNIEVRNEAIR